VYPAITTNAPASLRRSFIMHSQRTATSWTCDLVADDNNSSALGGAISVARTSVGDLIVAYVRKSASAITNLEVSRGAGTSWVATSVSSVTDDNHQLGQSVAIGLAPGGNPFVAFQHATISPWSSAVSAAIIGELAPIDVFRMTQPPASQAEVAAVGAASDGTAAHAFINIIGAAYGYFDVTRTAAGWHYDQIAPYASVASATGDDTGALHAAYCVPYQNTTRVYHVVR
jgi:hypothetical protein